MLSSLPGIGRSTSSGSQSVSINATVVMPSLRASPMAFFSFRGSTTTRHSGRRFIVRMPLRLRNILRYSRLSDDCIFFEYVASLSEPRRASSSSSRVNRLRMVRKLVKRAAQPAVADKRHAAAGALLLDRVAGLPLGADQQHQAPLGGHLLQVAPRPQQAADRLADVDDVDEIAAGVDVRPHLRVPTAGPMAEMDPGLDQVLYKNSSQRNTPSQAHRRSPRTYSAHSVCRLRHTHVQDA